MPNGSLDNHLFTRGHHLLKWETRVKVATGAARGLSFLHDLAIVVTHAGVKSSSILLDDEFNAKLSDLDLATVPRLTPFSTLDRNDYVSPEYIVASGTGRLTMKSDVYSFGIVLLELFTGLRVFDEKRPMNEQNLVVWVKQYFSNKKKLLEIVDSRLDSQYPHDGAYKYGKLALQCLSVDPKLRPRMAEVVDMLEKLSSPLSVGPHYFENSTELPTGIDKQMDHAGSSNWDVVFRPFNDMISGMSKGYSVDCRDFGETLDPADLSSNVMAIEYEGLIKATKNFNPNMLLGQGASGCVYKGWIPGHYLTATKPGCGITVAIKKMNLEGLLVYEFMCKGSLDYHLFTSGHSSLNWVTRVKVAIGAARAISFLHGTEIPVTCRCFKSSDILLDGDFNSKLSSFGLARYGPTNTSDRTHVFRVMGTYTYVAPEYFATGHLTARSDVYSFGVVLLELKSGLRVTNFNRREGAYNLIDWAKPYLNDKKRLSQIVDSRLEGKYPPKQAYEVAQICLQCLRVETKNV